MRTLLLIFLFLGIQSMAQQKMVLILKKFPLDEKIYISQKEARGNIVIDSFYIKSTETEKIYNYDRPYVWIIKLAHNDKVYIHFIKEPRILSIQYLPFPIGYKEFIPPHNYIVKGGGYENKSYDVFNKQDNFWVGKIVKSIDKRDSIDKNVDSVLYKRYKDSVSYYNKKRDTAIANFINTHKEAFASLIFYSNEVNRLNYVPMLKDLFKTLSPELRNREEGIRVRNILYPRLKKGDTYFDINQTDTSGNFYRLSDYKEKIILLDFWASWCAPCIDKFKELIPIYEKYKNDGFVVFAVSVDDNALKWKLAIQKGNYKWINVSELSGQITKPVIDYGVYEYPTNFLIDADGKIYKKNISFSELEKFLKEQFEKN